MNGIRVKNYTDNVVDLMMGKLKRLSSATQTALQQLACFGNVVEFATLTLVQGNLEEGIHTALAEAARAGLILRQENSYAFLHDRIHEAAYALIPEGERAVAHLRIGRVLLESMTADQLAEHLFDVANQFNQGAALLIDRYEKVQVATINLRAGRKAKASVAYVSARTYFSAGVALLDEKDWASQYELTFSLWLELTECELLTGNFEKTEQLFLELLQRASSKVDQARVYHLKVQFHIMKSEHPQAVASALTCLRLFGIDLPAHPTWWQVQAEYEAVWKALNGRSIESLIDLPLMTDPELLSAMQVLSVLTPAAYFTDFHLWCLQVCRMVNVTIQHGTSGTSAHAYGYWGTMLGPVFHRYCDAYRLFQSVTGLLLRNDPLDVVWRESEVALDFVRKNENIWEAKYGDAMHVIISQQRFIATMQGRTASFSTFSDAHFDEATFEAQLTRERMTITIAWYWILKLKAWFLSGDYAEALAAADKAKPLLSAAAAMIQLLDYFYYTALTLSALYENASADEQSVWRDLLTAHRQQLREWAENFPPTFGDKLALVSAEIARVEGRALDAMHL